MSQYYKPHRGRNLYNPANPEPFVVSRSGIDLYIECPRCFYLDRRLGTGRPPGFPFSLNTAVDALLKKEFDIHRAANTPHPLMKEYGVDAVPFAHEKLEEWRDSRLRGIKFFHEPTNLTIKGGIDDVWVNAEGQLHVVDYKATAKTTEVGIDAEWQLGYKRQMEVYQWLFRKNGFDISDIGYFVYCNGNTDKKAFDAKLEFDVKVIPYKGNDNWVEGTVREIKNCLDSDELPAASDGCDYCAYFGARERIEEKE